MVLILVVPSEGKVTPLASRLALWYRMVLYPLPAGAVMLVVSSTMPTSAPSHITANGGGGAGGGEGGVGGGNALPILNCRYRTVNP
ncbi:MAG: hypothetical protein CMD92_09455 [Gammaproteobacteria bacterium]|nr:hypothetical protein [Gammaproteobacteria bacterium]